MEELAIIADFIQGLINMEDLTLILYFFMGFMLLVQMVTWIRAYFLLRGAGEWTVIEVDEGEAAADIQAVFSAEVVYPGWLAENGFHPVGVYLLSSKGNPLRVVVWKKRDEQTSFHAYLLPKGRMAKEFASDMGDHSLCTCSMKVAQLLPMPPGKWLQTFAEEEIADLWIRHTAALEYITRQTGLRPGTDDPAMAEEIRKSVEARHQYVYSLPFWPLRIPYWLLVRTGRRHNKPIWELPEGVRL